MCLLFVGKLSDHARVLCTLAPPLRTQDPCQSVKVMPSGSRFPSGDRKGTVPNSLLLISPLQNWTRAEPFRAPSLLMALCKTPLPWKGHSSVCGNGSSACCSRGEFCERYHTPIAMSRFLSMAGVGNVWLECLVE